MKREFLRASRADGEGGATSQGMRWWVMYRVHGVHLTPIPQRHVSQVELDEEEESLEDFVNATRKLASALATPAPRR